MKSPSNKKDGKKKLFAFRKGKGKERKEANPPEPVEVRPEAAVDVLDKFELSSSEELVFPNPISPVGRMQFGADIDDYDLYLGSSDEGPTDRNVEVAPFIPVEDFTGKDWENEGTTPRDSTQSTPLGEDDEMGGFNMFSNPLSSLRPTAKTAPVDRAHAESVSELFAHYSTPQELELDGEVGGFGGPAHRPDELKRLEEQRRKHAEKKRLETGTPPTELEVGGVAADTPADTGSADLFSHFSTPTEFKLDAETDSSPQANRRNFEWKRMEEQRRKHAEKKRLEIRLQEGGKAASERNDDVDSREEDARKRAFEDAEMIFWGSGSEDDDDASLGLGRPAPSKPGAYETPDVSAGLEWNESSEEQFIEEEDAAREEEEREKRMLESLKDIRREKQEEEDRRRRLQVRKRAALRKKKEQNIASEGAASAASAAVSTVEPPSLLWADDDDIWDADDTMYGEESRSYDQMELERKYPIRLPQREGKMYVKKEGRPKWIHEYLVLKEDKLYFLSKPGKLPPLRIVSFTDKKTSFVWHKEQSLQAKKKTKAFIVMTCNRGVYHIADPSATHTEEWRAAIEENRQREWGPTKRKTTKNTKNILFRNNAG